MKLKSKIVKIGDELDIIGERIIKVRPISMVGQQTSKVEIIYLENIGGI